MVEICWPLFEANNEGKKPKVMSLPEFSTFAHEPNPNAIKDIIKTIKSFPAFFEFIETPHLFDQFITNY
jgi:hypothetical protein